MSDFRRADGFLDVPMNRFLGFRVGERSDGRTEVSMPLRAEFAQELGVVHGGLIATLADTAAVYSILPRLPDDGTLVGLEFKLNFLSPAAVDGEDLRAVATPVRVGRRVAVSRVDVRQGERDVATGLFTYLLGRSRPDSRGAVPAD